MKPSDPMIESVSRVRRYALLTGEPRDSAEEGLRAALYYMLRNGDRSERGRLNLFAIYEAVRSSLSLLRGGNRAEAVSHADRLTGAILDLPLEERQALILMNMEDFTSDETGYILDCPPSEATSRLARARARIDQLVRPLYVECGA